MSSAQCDFCSAPEVKWAYPCRDFIARPMPGLPDQGYVGSWGACSACYSLIERGDRDGLAKRSAKRLARSHGIPLKLANRATREVQDRFFSNREGTPLPTETGADDPAVDQVPAQYRLGPDQRELARALSIPSGSVRAIHHDYLGQPDVVYFERGDVMFRAAVKLEGERSYMRVSEDHSLGASWNDLRLPIEAGEL